MFEPFVRKIKLVWLNKLDISAGERCERRLKTLEIGSDEAWLSTFKQTKVQNHFLDRAETIWTKEHDKLQYLLIGLLIFFINSDSLSISSPYFNAFLSWFVRFQSPDTSTDQEMSNFTEWLMICKVKNQIRYLCNQVMMDARYIEFKAKRDSSPCFPMIS